MRRIHLHHVPLLALGVAALGLLLNVTGCSRSIRPPDPVREPVSVHVAEYGKHASLVLPDAGGHVVEWSWGDWNYFALSRTSLRDGLAALFWSEAATLARRTLADPGDPERLRRALGASEIVTLPVERAKAEALHRELQARYDRNQASEVWNAGAGRYFVREDDHGRYWLLNTSAHEVSRWLASLDVEVRGFALTGEFAPARGSSATVVGAPDDRFAPGHLFD